MKLKTRKVVEVKKIIQIKQKSHFNKHLDRSKAMAIKDNKKLKRETVVESSSTVANNHNTLGALRGFREVPPAHYIFKIQSFSLLLNSKTEIYESRPFEDGGYNWKLTLYPNGNKKMNVNGHISLYLTIADTEKLPVGWEVNASFKLFVFNPIIDKYLTIQLDAEGGISRFHRMKSEWGFDEFLSHDTFNDASNGYLIDDCCIFGAEVFVIKHTGKGECFSMIKNPVNNKYIWKIKKFSEMKEEEICSDEFVVGAYKWKLLFFTEGIGNVIGERVSLFLEFNDLGLLFAEQRVYAEFKLRIRQQLSGLHVEKGGHAWFSAASPEWGFGNFLSLADLHNASKGYIVNDTVIVEAEITLISSFKDF